MRQEGAIGTGKDTEFDNTKINCPEFGGLDCNTLAKTVRCVKLLLLSIHSGRIDMLGRKGVMPLCWSQ